MGLLSLVEQPTRYNSGMITLRKVEWLVKTYMFNRTDLHDYRDTGIIENLWGELGMPESLSLVPRE